MNKREDREREKKRKKKNRRHDRESIVEREFRRSRGIFDYSIDVVVERTHHFLDIRCSPCPTYWDSRNRNDYPAIVDYTFSRPKKKKKAKPVEAEWRSWKRFVLKMEWKIGRYDRHGGYMGYWTIIIEQQNFRLDT